MMIDANILDSISDYCIFWYTKLQYTVNREIFVVNIFVGPLTYENKAHEIFSTTNI